ncbi:hypothetical protein HDG34_003254 [Paraburkholderia sp. HC6.4b]|uniref:hypothetical protein n=1 Tax=unclassified Paraburkholderia TaxID=2615204 RepID=UPI00160D560C|nr:MULTISPECIES: hypothetical protein [unclassified Paraburkholderia]MBB5409313.1 hypothetical protein [Paraburkholderia sp. HC6.4b]MBB5451041.1 hypothetical protein [Paraburkholderia sp. Kb1A]
MKRYATAYDTTQCSGYVLDRLDSGLKAALLAGALAPSNEAATILEVHGGQPLADAVPEFAHPWLITHEKEREQTHGHDWRGTIVFDARPFGAFDRIKGQFLVRNEIEYGLQRRRAQLNDIWVNDDPALLRDVSPVAMSLFAGWISENLARRFALDPREQLNMAILSAIHYLSLFSDDGNIDTPQRIKMAMQVSRGLRCPAEEVMTLLEKRQHEGPGIIGLCGAAADATGSVRLRELNPGILISIVKGTWFGINAAEMLAVALEHPPTWLALLAAAHIERTYRNSGLARMVERQAHKEPNQLFLRAVLNLAQLADRGSR